MIDGRPAPRSAGRPSFFTDTDTGDRAMNPLTDVMARHVFTDEDAPIYAEMTAEFGDPLIDRCTIPTEPLLSGELVLTTPTAGIPVVDTVTLPAITDDGDDGEE
jgi:hypothetical protein